MSGRAGCSTISWSSACWRAPRQSSPSCFLRAWQTGLVLLLVLGVGAWTALDAVVDAAFSPNVAVHLSGAENPSRTLKTRVLLSGFDPTYIVEIEQTDRGVHNRRFTVGCVNGDALSLDAVRWLEDDVLLVDSSAGAVAITIADDGTTTRIRPAPDHFVDEGSLGPLEVYPCGL